MSIYYSRYYIAFWTIVVVPAITYYIAIGQYQNISGRGNEIPRHSWDTLKYVRPLLSTEEKRRIYTNTLYGETSFVMADGEDEGDVIKLRFFQGVNGHGNFQAPEMFYEGVTFRIGVENSHGIDYAQLEMPGEEISRKLQDRLQELSPPPTSIMPSMSHYNVSGWVENGFAAHYSYEDLRTHGKLSSDPERPWKRVLDPVLNIAREFKQVYATVWYPHSFGDAARHVAHEPHKSPYQSPSKKEARKKKDRDPRRRMASVISAANGDLGEAFWLDTDQFPPQDAKTTRRLSEIGDIRRSLDTPLPKHVFQSIIQMTIPTHTGLDEMTSSCAVWLASVNHKENEPIRNVYKEGR